MVDVLEKIRLVIKECIIHIKNPCNEEIIDYMTDNTFIFDKGKIYGIVCEHGCGGDAISALISNHVSCEKVKIYMDDNEINSDNIGKIGWYVGGLVYSNGLIKREKSVKKALRNAIKKYHRYETIDEIINEFHLTIGRLNYGISKYSWEKWRASLAIGYASNKIVYCFPWMNTFYFYDCLLNSAIYCFFKKIKEQEGIIILPTSRRENVEDFVDEIIEIRHSRFESVISENPYFKDYF